MLSKPWSLMQSSNTKTNNYRLIEGQEKQSWLEKYISQFSDFERNESVELFHNSLGLEIQKAGSSRDSISTYSNNYLSSYAKTSFTNPAPSYTNNQENISSLSELISKNRDQITNRFE